MIHRSEIQKHILQKAKQAKKPLPAVTKKEAEKVMLEFEDLLMKVVSFKGLDVPDVPDMLKNFKDIKNNLKWSVESILRLKKYNERPPEETTNQTDETTLNVKSDKKYTF